MKGSFDSRSSSFIDAHRQNRRRRYSISSPHVFESRAGTTVRHNDTLHKQSSRVDLSDVSSNVLFAFNQKRSEKYDILSKLNVGAFGATYLIRDSNDGQTYLLKRIDSSLPDPFRQRLFAERRLLSSLKSSYILALVAAYVDSDHHCFAMKFEHVSGLTLLHLLRRFRWFEEAAVAFYLAQIVLAFEYLHELQIIYVSVSASSRRPPPRSIKSAAQSQTGNDPSHRAGLSQAERLRVCQTTIHTLRLDLLSRRCA